MYPPAHAQHVNFPASWRSFTYQCQGYCVAGCCGLDAFCFEEVMLKPAVLHFGIAWTEAMCDEATQAAVAFRSVHVECWSPQEDFCELWPNGEAVYQWMAKVIQDTRCIIDQLKQEPLSSQEPIG